MYSVIESGYSILPVLICSCTPILCSVFYVY